MTKENGIGEGEAEVILGIEIGPEDRIIAFCSNCKSIIFKGNDDTPAKHRVLNERLRDHLDFFDWNHNIDVIFPARKTDKVIDAQVFLSTGASLTAREGLLHHYKMSNFRQASSETKAPDRTEPKKRTQPRNKK